MALKRWKRKTTVYKVYKQEVSSNLKGRRMQMNILRTKQVSHVRNRDDHGQPIAGGDGQRCRRRVIIIIIIIIIKQENNEWLIVKD